AADARRHLLPTVVPADRLRRHVRRGLAVVRPREEDRLATDLPAPSGTCGRGDRRWPRPGNGAGRHLARHAYPALLLPHLPDRAPPPHPEPPARCRPRNPRVDQGIDERSRPGPGRDVVAGLQRLGTALGPIPAPP